MVQVCTIGNAQKGIAGQSADAFDVTASLTMTPSFQRTMSNPAERDAFTRGVDTRLEMALAKGDKTMYDVLSALRGKIKSYNMAGTDIYSSEEGFRAIG